MAIRKVYKIDQATIEQLKTDADKIDYASKHCMSPLDLQFAIAMHQAIRTPCENCENVGQKGWFPCNDCIRCKKDHYKSIYAEAVSDERK